MVEVILGVVYLLIAIGTAIGAHDKNNILRFQEIVACVVIGLFWPVIVGAYFGKDFK